MPDSAQKATAQEPGFKEKIAVYVETAQVYAKPYLDLPNDSFKKTVAVALALCLVGAIVVSGSAVILKPLQEWNKAKDEKINILEVAGLYQKGSDVDAAFKPGLDVQDAVVTEGDGNRLEARRSLRREVQREGGERLGDEGGVDAGLCLDSTISKRIGHVGWRTGHCCLDSTTLYHPAAILLKLNVG